MAAAVHVCTYEAVFVVVLDPTIGITEQGNL